MADKVNVREKFDERKKNHNIEFELKDEQVEIAKSIMKGRNVLGFLPTGFGKTLCMVLPTVMIEEKSITLVVSPLTSLIEDQMSTLEKWNFKCVKVESFAQIDTEYMHGITKGEYQFVFSSPEAILKPAWKRVFLSSTWQSRLKLIAIDEAHCISEWGKDFRKDFQQLGEIRSFFRVPVMALTATTTTKVKDDIMKHLHLTEEDTDVVFRSSDRPNIFIEILKRESTDYAISLKWLIDHIKENGIHSKKCIVYCRSIDTLSEIFLTIKTLLGKDAYAGGTYDASHLLVEMFHKSTHEESKHRILSNFKSETGTIRCVVATVALGMGLDIRDIDLVIHIGSPKSILSYWQEAGRCARDGRQGLSLIYFDNFTLSLKSTGKDIACMLKTQDKCIRQQILDALTVGEKTLLKSCLCTGCSSERCLCDACKCCSICSAKCPCSETKGLNIYKFLQDNKGDNTNT